MFPRWDSLIFERQGRSLAKMGYKVHFVVCDLLPNEIVDGVEIVSCDFKPSSRKERILKTRKILYKKAVEVNADIYQISEPELIPIGIKLKKKGKKVIYNMREYSSADMIHKRYLPGFLRVPIGVLLAQYMKKSLQKYDAVFSVTPELVDVVSFKWGIQHSYLLTNYPIMDLNYQVSLEEYSSRGDVLCYIGTVYKMSRQENVFAALEKLPQVRYLIAGIIGVENERLTDLPYWKNVEFINGFEKKKLPDIFAKCSMSNVLRDDSNSGTPNGSLGVIKIFESMEAALPIICSDVPVYNEMIKKYQCGICVDPNNPDEIYKAIKYLVENKEAAYEMGQNGRRAVLKEYNWDSQFRTYFNILSGL
jgi:glycosyltransferase involved in cell wall biosynthesis